MIRLIEKNIMRVFVKIFVFAALTSLAWATNAEPADGKWRFEKTADYSANDKKSPAPKFPTADVLGKKMLLLSKCFVYFKDARQEEAFKPLLNAGEAVDDIDSFLKKNFSLELDRIQKYYTLEQSDCAEKFGEFAFVSADKLLVTRGTVFRQYARHAAIAIDGVKPALAGRLPTPLPFSVSSYLNLCSSRILNAKGEPQTTMKCAPVYYPYAISKKVIDPLAKLIGSHNYEKDLPEKLEADYNNPVAKGLHPTFLVLPPFNGILLVRVDDFEQGERYDRDGIQGAYLTIKDGKVIDQLNQGCDIDEQYYCTDSGGRRRYQLLETGKFKSLN